MDKKEYSSLTNMNEKEDRDIKIKFPSNYNHRMVHPIDNDDKAKVILLKCQIKELEQSNYSLRKLHVESNREHKNIEEMLQKRIEFMEKEKLFSNMSKTPNTVIQNENLRQFNKVKDFYITKQLFKEYTVNELSVILKYMHCNNIPVIIENKEVENLVKIIERKILEDKNILPIIQVILFIIESNSKIFDHFSSLIYQKYKEGLIPDNFIIEIIDKIPLDLLENNSEVTSLILGVISSARSESLIIFFSNILTYNVFIIKKYMSVSHFKNILICKKYKNFVKKIISDKILFDHYVPIDLFHYIIEEFIL